MFKNESPRQKKFNNLLQKELAILLQNYIRKGAFSNLIISVTKVYVTPDLSLAKIYISVFPSNKSLILIENLSSNSSKIKHDLSQNLKNQLRKIPELKFILDDSTLTIYNIIVFRYNQIRYTTNNFSREIPHSCNS